VKFEWDPGKAAANKRKHGVTFQEAADCFEDPLGLVLDEPAHPERLILIAISRRRRLIFTVYAERDVAVIRIISARLATPHERRAYEEGE
jgi:uncharacterized DUF497 family protein